MLMTRSTNQGILMGKDSSIHGEWFLITFYKYQVKFYSRYRFSLLLLWREFVFLQLHCIFLQGCNSTDENNEDWCHVQLLNLFFLHISLSLLGLGHHFCIIFFPSFHFLSTCISTFYFPVFFHLVLVISCCNIELNG